MLLVLDCTSIVEAQLFIPMAVMKPHRQIRLECRSGCYPTPNDQFFATLYDIPLNALATFNAISVSNPTAYDFCFGPTNAAGCQRYDEQSL
jgi:hypothetical protein